VVLLFAKERRRRSNRFDWTRRWGIICSYVSMLLGIARIVFIWVLPLVAIGICCLFMSMPRRYQPWFTDLFVRVSLAWFRHGPARRMLAPVLAAFSSAAVLLACAPLYNALRSSYPKRLEAVAPKNVVAVLVAPLALFALMHIAQAGLYCLGGTGAVLTIIDYGAYFRPKVLVESIAAITRGAGISGQDQIASVVEAIKWFIVLTIAIWLSIAQVAAWRDGKETRNS
jgi:hypothetical protein